MDEYADTGNAVCVSDLCQKVTMDVIARCALATKANCLRDGKDKLLNDVKEFLANAESIAFHLASGIPAIAEVLTKLAKLVIVLSGSSPVSAWNQSVES